MRYECGTCGMIANDNPGQCPACRSDMTPIIENRPENSYEVDTEDTFKGADVSKHGIKGG